MTKPSKLALALLLALAWGQLKSDSSDTERIRAKARAESEKVALRKSYLKLTDLDRSVLKLTSQNKISHFGTWYGAGYTYLVRRDYSLGQAHESITFYLDIAESKPVLRLDKGAMAFVTMHQLDKVLVAVWQAGEHFEADGFGINAKTQRLEQIFEKFSWDEPEMLGRTLVIRGSKKGPGVRTEISL